MKIRGQVLTATHRFEFDIKKKIGKCSSGVGNRRIPKYTIHNTHVVSTYSEQVLAHSSSRNTGIPAHVTSPCAGMPVVAV